ncbi:MAG: hypothetical protein ABS882_12505 [Lysinibacillus sp.]
MELTGTKQMYKVGVTALLLSSILTALSQVFYASKVQAVHPFIFTGISFLLTTLYFQSFTSKAGVSVNWRKSWYPLVKLNAVTAVTFMGYYFALKYVEPAIVTSLEIGVAPLFMLLQRQEISRLKWFVSFGTLAACSILIFGVLSGSSGVTEQISIQTLIGLIASVICGIGAIYCTEYSKVLNKIGWTSSMILSKRYYVVIVLSFAVTYDQIILYFMDNIGWILLVTALGVIAPSYFMQKGVQYTNTFLVMMLLGFIPVFTFFFQLFDSRLQYSIITLVGVLLLFGMGLLSIKEGES